MPSASIIVMTLLLVCDVSYVAMILMGDVLEYTAISVMTSFSAMLLRISIVKLDKPRISNNRQKFRQTVSLLKLLFVNIITDQFG